MAKFNQSDIDLITDAGIKCVLADAPIGVYNGTAFIITCLRGNVNDLIDYLISAKAKIVAVYTKHSLFTRFAIVES